MVFKLSFVLDTRFIAKISNGCDLINFLFLIMCAGIRGQVFLEMSEACDGEYRLRIWASR